MVILCHRRRFFEAVPALALALAAAPVGVGLSGCAQLQGLSTPQKISQVAADVAAIADGLAGVLPSLGQVSGIDAGTVAKVGGYVADLQKVAATLAGAGTTAEAQPLVKQVEQFVNAIAGALAGLALPPPIGPAITAASVLLPVIEAAVNLAVPAAAPAGAMTPDEARAILNDLAAPRSGGAMSPGAARALLNGLTR